MSTIKTRTLVTLTAIAVMLFVAPATVAFGHLWPDSTGTSLADTPWTTISDTPWTTAPADTPWT